MFQSEFMLLIAAFFFGLTNVLGKRLAPLYSFAVIYSFVTIISWALLLLITILTGEIRQCTNIRRRDILWIVAYALCGFAIPLYFLLLAYKYSPAAEIGFLLKADSISAVMFSYVILRERVKIPQLLGVIVMLVGAFLLLTGFGSWRLDTGSFFALITAILWGWSYGMAKILLRRGFSPFLLAMLKQGVSIPLVFPILLTGAASVPSVFGPGTLAVILLILFSICPHVVAHPLFNYGLRNTQTWLGASLLLTDAIFSAILAYLLLGERLTLVRSFGAVCILAGALLVLEMLPRICSDDR